MTAVLCQGIWAWLRVVQPELAAKSVSPRLSPFAFGRLVPMAKEDLPVPGPALQTRQVAQAWAQMLLARHTHT